MEEVSLSESQSLRVRNVPSVSVAFVKRESSSSTEKSAFPASSLKSTIVSALFSSTDIFTLDRAPGPGPGLIIWREGGGFRLATNCPLPFLADFSRGKMDENPRFTSASSDFPAKLDGAGEGLPRELFLVESQARFLSIPPVYQGSVVPYRGTAAGLDQEGTFSPWATATLGVSISIMGSNQA